MTALDQSPPLTSTLALAGHASIAATLDASVPAIVLADDRRTLRYINAAAAHVLGISDARPMLGQPAPLDEAVLKHLQRVTAANTEGRGSSERIRYYRGIKPIVLSLDVLPLGNVAGEPAILVTLPDLAQPNVDVSLQATLTLYAGSDDLITAFGETDVLAVAGRHAVLDEAPAEIEAIVEQALTQPTALTHVKTAHGQRTVLVVRVDGGSAVRRLMYIGPLEPVSEAGLPEPAIGSAETPALTLQPGTMTETPFVSCDAVAVPAPMPLAFIFTRQSKPRRFTWELDRDGRFVAIGHDFAASLGPLVAPRIGDTWADLASRLSIDADAGIARLLHGRRPWHGQTIAWPVEGEALRAPVELTAMPYLDADQQFAGIRGFGVIRSALATDDPFETGVHLVPRPVAAIPAHPEPIVPAAPSTEIDVAAVPPVWDLAEGPDAKFPRLVASPMTTFDDDHLVTLMPVAHISPETLRLSGAERNAFRQIAEALGARFEGDDPLLASTAVGHPMSRVPRTPEQSIHVLSTQELLDQLDGRAPGAASSDVDWRRRPLIEGDTTLIDRLPIAVGLTRNEAVIHVNAAFLTLTGYDTLEDLNRAGGLDVLFAGPHAAKGWAEDRNRHHIPLVTRSGRVLPVDARIASVPWTGGTALLITLVAGDRPGASAPDTATGDLRAILGSARERVGELEAILSTLSDGIVMLRADGHILSATAPAEALFGVDPGSLVGKTLADLMAPESRRATTDYLDGLARNGIGSLLQEGQELVVQATPDRHIPVFVTIAKISRGAELLFAATFRDISRWKTSEEELTLAKRRAEEASLQKSDFLAKISHEIRTPLNAIIGFPEVMLGERFGAIGVERYKDYLRDIQSSGTHIMSLVNDLLDLSKVEAGKLELKFESVQLTDILSDCVAMMQPQANRERIIIRASLTQGVPPVVADQRSIRQIVLNLLSNAIKFTPAGGQVIVSAALEDSNDVVIRVRDTGYGMSPKDLEIALEPFRQVHNSRGRNTGPGPGTGLGLPLTKALVEANRAALKIDSAVNQGTLVQVTFPAPRVLAAE